jgi:hypothetical protein
MPPYVSPRIAGKSSPMIDEGSETSLGSATRHWLSAQSRYTKTRTLSSATVSLQCLSAPLRVRISPVPTIPIVETAMAFLLRSDTHGLLGQAGTGRHYCELPAVPADTRCPRTQPRRSDSSRQPGLAGSTGRYFRFARIDSPDRGIPEKVRRAATESRVSGAAPSRTRRSLRLQRNPPNSNY